MVSRQGFPLEDFESDLEKMTSALERAEGQFSKDKGLPGAIKDAEASATKLIMIKLVEFYWHLNFGWWSCRQRFDDWKLIVNLTEKPEYVSRFFWSRLGAHYD